MKVLFSDMIHHYFDYTIVHAICRAIVVCSFPLGSWASTAHVVLSLGQNGQSWDLVSFAELNDVSANLINDHSTVCNKMLIS